MRSTTLFRASLCTVPATLLIACGGGGGDTQSNASTQAAPLAAAATPSAEGVPQTTSSAATFNVMAAIHSFLLGGANPATKMTYALTATSAAGTQYGMKVEVSGSPSGGYEQRYLTVDGKPVTVHWYGTLSYPYSGTSFTYTQPFKIESFRENMVNTWSPAESYSPPPTAKVGDSGVLFILPKVFVNGTTAEEDVTQWSFEPATAETAWFCLNEFRRITVAGGVPTYSPLEAKECAQVTPEGKIVGFKADVYDKDLGTLAFR